MSRGTARDENGGVLVPIGDTPSPVSPVRRLRRVRSTMAALPGLGLEIQSTPDGRKAVLLPPALLDFFVEDLERRAAEWKEQARKARVAEQCREAELRVASGEARREWDATADAWTAQYLTLREEGKGYRESLRLIRGPKQDRREYPQICQIELGLKEGLARRRAQRHADICRLAAEGMPRQAIADKFRLSYVAVHKILKAAGIPAASGDCRKAVRPSAHAVD